MRKTLQVLGLLSAVCGLAGCGESRPETARVSGTVEFDGELMTTAQYGSVVFTPTGGRLAKGRIESDGSFELSTFRSGDGAITGIARVGVSATVDGPGSSPEEKYQGVRWLIPMKFGSGDTSGLTCEVQAGKNVFKISLSSDGTGTIEAQGN